MKTKGSTAWVFTTMVAVVLFMAACGNSQKKKEQAKVQATEQPASSPTAGIILASGASVTASRPYWIR